VQDSRKSNPAGSLIARRLRCQGCLRRYRLQDVSQIDQDDHVTVFNVRCAMCSRQRLIIAEQERGRIKLLHTDLDDAEWRHYRSQPSVDCDDVIRTYADMSRYDGDLTDVLEDPLLSDSSLVE
jgi:hypothetical protein